MNVIAGILIGIANDTWLARLIVPLGWGIVWCIQHWSFQDKLKAFVENAKRHKLPVKWGMTYTQAFYFVEYSTATIDSLIFSVLTGFLKDLLFSSIS